MTKLLEVNEKIKNNEWISVNGLEGLCDTKYLKERYLYISNNDEGMKKIAVNIDSKENIVIDFNNGKLLFDEGLIPIVITNSKNITIKNLAIDWVRPFYLQGQVINNNTEKDYYDLRILDECIYEVRGEKLYFRGKPANTRGGVAKWPAPTNEMKTWEQNLLWNMWFNEDKTTPINEAQYMISENARVEELEPGIVRIYHSTKVLPKVGMHLVIKGKKDLNRQFPGIFIAQSSNINIENVTVYHSGGMALIAQRCENVYLKNYNVKIPENSKRVCSASADGSHFNGCKGEIIMDNCYFENMLDDALNVHGTYVIITEVIDDNSLICHFGHSQQNGLVFAERGDIVRSFVAETLEYLEDYHVEEVEIYNSQYFRLKVSENIRGKLKPGMVLDNGNWQPSVVVKNCIVKNNRARGLLIQTIKPVLIENNLFDGSSAKGIQFAGEAIFWYEAGFVSNVVIRNNTFNNLRSHIISICPRVDYKINPNVIFHRNIVVKNNTINTIHKLMITANSVDGLKFIGNTVNLLDNVYNDSNSFSIKYSKNVEISGNIYNYNGKSYKSLDDLQ